MKGCKTEQWITHANGLMWITISVLTAFILNCAILASAQLNQNMCNGRMDGILFPDHENCDLYIQCQGGAAMRQRCQAGTLFDLNLYYCSVAHTVDCGSRRQPNLSSVPIPPRPNYPVEMPTTSESHHSVCRNMHNGAMIANPNNCRAYIECQQNLRLDRECASGELYEAGTGVCLSDFAVDCGARSILPPTNEVAGRNVCAGQRNGVRIADHRNCRQYFECQNQQGLSRECGPNDLFEVNLGMCIVALAVSCAGRGGNVPQPPLLSADGELPRTICNGLPAGTRISDPQSCEGFYECRNNQRTRMTCPTNDAFDSSSNQCRIASTVNCGTRRSMNEQNIICQGQRNAKRFGNPQNCRAYIECQQNLSVDKTCDAGLLFDTQLEACLGTHLVRCGARGIPPTQTPQSPEDFFPACPRTGVLFRPHPHDCQGYFICASGQLIQHSCANGVHFNPDTLQCDLAQNVQCRLSRIVIPQTPLLPDCTSGQNFYPNLVNCKQYYMCVNKKPQLMNCPGTLLWDNKQIKCAKSESEICARSFNPAMGTFVYSRPRDDEKKSKSKSFFY